MADINLNIDAELHPDLARELELNRTLKARADELGPKKVSADLRERIEASDKRIAELQTPKTTAKTVAVRKPAPAPAPESNPAPTLAPQTAPAPAPAPAVAPTPAPTVADVPGVKK